jgi:hypothetical protein
VTHRSNSGATFCPPTGWKRRCAAIVAAVGAALALILGGSCVAQAALQPLNLRVDGGEESWRSSQLFALRWSNPPGSIAAVHYRLLDPNDQELIADRTLPWSATSLEPISVLPAPGAYTAEVWLEDSSGALGEPVSARLRFDNARPGDVEPVPEPKWIGRTSFPFAIHLSHPQGPQPLSGIRGYAISVDAAASGDPCAETCDEAETDLRAGVGGDTIFISELPEGNNYVHAVAVSGAGMPSSSAGTAILRVDKRDPQTTIAGVPTGWSKEPVALTATAADAESGMAAGGGSFTAIRIDGGAPAVAAGASATTTVIASGVHTVDYYARDTAGNVNDGGLSNSLPNRPPEKAIIRIDRKPPALAFSGAQSPLDPEQIEVRAVDFDSGLDLSRGTIAVRRVGSGERFTNLATEVSAGLLRARWNSSAYPDGEYEFQATSFDRAGNRAVTSVRVDGTAMRLQAPLKTALRLITRTNRHAVRYGRGTRFAGRLIAGRHTPVAGMAVRVIEHFSTGSAPAERVSTVRTEADGEFGLRLAPGPSRTVIAEVAPTATTRPANSDPIAITVDSRLVLLASSAAARIGGRPVIFRGKVGTAGASLPADGRVVQLQFRLPGLPWSEFRTVRTNRQGRFRYAYRFADDDSRGVRFQFRAYAPAQAGWPFEPAGSLPVTVVGV